jgi:hypothetical protein
MLNKGTVMCISAKPVRSGQSPPTAIQSAKRGIVSRPWRTATTGSKFGVLLMGHPNRFLTVPCHNRMRPLEP